MILSRKLDTNEIERLHERASKRLGAMFDPAMIGVRMSHETLCLKERPDSTGQGGYELDGIATTGSLDQDEEVVVPGGGDWSLLTDPKSRYKSLYTDHYYGTSNVVATVRWVKRATFPDGWQIRARFMPDDYGEHVKQTRMLAERGALGLSIGFQALDRGAPDASEKAKYPGARSVVRKWKVFEVSTTPMPCNLDCGASMLWVDDGKAAQVGELVSKGLAPEWASKRFVRPARRVVVCRV